MKNKIYLMITIAVFGLAFGGCSASFSTGNNGANTAKTTNTASSPTAKKDSNSNSTAKKEAPKTALTSEKKPEGASKKAKENPVPDNWIYIYDEAKGYGFYVPEGTTGGSDSSGGVDTFMATTPAPSEVSVVVIAFKDKQMTKDDLLDVGVKFLEELGEEVTPIGDLRAESDNYAVGDALTVSEDGTKGKVRILVGTDVTDNYIMIIGSSPKNFTANEKTIDLIWGSFEIWSGVS